METSQIWLLVYHNTALNESPLFWQSLGNCRLLEHLSVLSEGLSVLSLCVLSERVWSDWEYVYPGWENVCISTKCGCVYAEWVLLDGMNVFGMSECVPVIHLGTAHFCWKTGWDQGSQWSSGAQHRITEPEIYRQVHVLLCSSLVASSWIWEEVMETDEPVMRLFSSLMYVRVASPLGPCDAEWKVFLHYV